MKAYRVLIDGLTEPTDAPYFHRRSEAHAQAKLQEPRSDVRVEEVLVEVNAELVFDLLNGAHAHDFFVVRTWALGDRGGLREVRNGE